MERRWLRFKWLFWVTEARGGERELFSPSFPFFFSLLTPSLRFKFCSQFEYFSLDYPSSATFSFYSTAPRQRNSVKEEDSAPWVWERQDLLFHHQQQHSCVFSSLHFYFLEPREQYSSYNYCWTASSNQVTERKELTISLSSLPKVLSCSSPFRVSYPSEYLRIIQSGSEPILSFKVNCLSYPKFMCVLFLVGKWTSVRKFSLLLSLSCNSVLSLFDSSTIFLIIKTTKRHLFTFTGISSLIKN